MRVIQVVHCGQEPDYEMVVADVPLWALAINRVAQLVDHLTCHFVCEHFYRSFGWALFLDDTQARVIYRFSISAEAAHALGAEDHE